MKRRRKRNPKKPEPKDVLIDEEEIEDENEDDEPEPEEDEPDEPEVEYSDSDKFDGSGWILKVLIGVAIGYLISNWIDSLMPSFKNYKLPGLPTDFFKLPAGFTTPNPTTLQPTGLKGLPWNNINFNQGGEGNV